MNYVSVSLVIYSLRFGILTTGTHYSVIETVWPMLQWNKTKGRTCLPFGISFVCICYHLSHTHKKWIHHCGSSSSWFWLLFVISEPRLLLICFFCLDHYFLFKKCRKLGWEPKPGESHLDALLRGELLTVLAELGHEGTLNEAIRRFEAFCADRNSPLLPPDTRKVL